MHSWQRGEEDRPSPLGITAIRAGISNAENAPLQNSDIEPAPHSQQRRGPRARRRRWPMISAQHKSRIGSGWRLVWVPQVEGPDLYFVAERAVIDGDHLELHLAGRWLRCRIEGLHDPGGAYLVPPPDGEPIPLSSYMALRWPSEEGAS